MARGIGGQVAAHSTVTLLALPVRPAPHFAHALAAVRQWLLGHPHWLIILDNLEDPQVLDQIALVGRGSVLITTRAQAIGAVGGCFEVPPLPEEEGAAFLLRRSKIARVEGQASAADCAADFCIGAVDTMMWA